MPGWRNGHNYSSSAAEWALNNVVIPDVKKAHPDWPTDLVKHEGVRLWNARLAQDRAYFEDEMKHLDGATQWDVVEIDGREQLATRYGEGVETLEGLWANTEKFAASEGKSHLVDQEEKAAQIEMQRKIITGEATAFVSTLSHPDSVEIVQIWEKTSDNSFVSKQINLFSVIGRTLSHSEGAMLIQHVFDFLKQTGGSIVEKVKSLHPHFMLQVGKIQSDLIRTIVRGMDSVKHNASQLRLQVQGALEYAGKAMRQMIERKVGPPRESSDGPFLVLRRSLHVDSLKEKKTKNKPGMERVHRIIDRLKTRLDINRLIKKRSKREEKILLLPTVLRIETRFEKSKKTIREVVYAAKSKFVEKYKNVVRMIRVQKDRIVRPSVASEKLRKILRKTKDTLVKKPTVIYETLLRSIRGNIKKLEFKTLMKRLRNLFVKNKDMRVKLEVKRVKKKGILVAFINLFLLRKNKDTPKDIVQKVDKKRSLEKIDMQPLTQWALLAIIWRMTMKREGGIQTSQANSRQKKSKKPAVYPQQVSKGVIFAYAT